MPVSWNKPSFASSFQSDLTNPFSNYLRIESINNILHFFIWKLTGIFLSITQTSLIHLPLWKKWFEFSNFNLWTQHEKSRSSRFCFQQLKRSLYRWSRFNSLLSWLKAMSWLTIQSFLILHLIAVMNWIFNVLWRIHFHDCRSCILSFTRRKIETILSFSSFGHKAQLFLQGNLLSILSDRFQNLSPQSLFKSFGLFL